MDIRPLGIGRLTRVVICGLLAAAAFPASALTQTDTTTISQSLPFAGTPMGCTEPVAVTGTAHVLAHLTMAADGSPTMSVDNASTQNTSGVGTISGLPYQYSSETLTTDTQNTSKFVVTTILIRQGEATIGNVDDDFVFHVIGHTTYSAGVPAVVIDSVTTDPCR